ncbi:hypothetical protein [Bosea sp. BIWAKO-01]|uniref:hypothetical protein n=1 Tax=Bosea sp. BIWAKO-01 TaxID=506668 RepID=UPI00086AEDE2|nr:hypothetical protein [Bosea sp. BIWAKO-01]GAU84469.1 hypothetical protein BIWAKO_04404 [Bosea sp. BIWAKO-01]
MISLSFGFRDRSSAGNYRIVRVLPAAENGQRQYRVRGSDGHERAIEEHQIRAGVAEKNHFGNLK